MQNIWFTSDTHHGHTNIIKYCNRPFQGHEEMDIALLENFNSVIKPGDRLYHLGDVSYSTYDISKFYKKLNCKDIQLIKGNHDGLRNSEYVSKMGLRWVGDYKELRLDDIKVVLFHYAMLSWHGRGNGAIQLFGHSHGKLQGVGRSMDVGVDTNNYFPYNWEDIKARMQPIPYKVDEG